MIELLSPSKVIVNQETLQLIEQVDDAISKFNKLRPLDSETEQRIKQAFLPDRVTASINMEGIVATRRQTLAIMDAMTLGETSSRSEQEIRNALQADEFVFEATTDSRAIDENFIKDVNRLIEENIGECPGQYRPRDIKISQALFTPPSHLDVPSLMHELVKIFNQSSQTAPIIQAAWLHNRFTHIHPFLDGNGRTARLLQDFALLRGGLFPTGVPSSLRDDYYDALADSDKNAWDALVTIIAQRQLDVILKATGIANERKVRAAWVNTLANRAQAKKNGTQHKRYLVWTHRMKEVQSSFEAAANEISTASDVISVRHKNLEIVDFATWREICQTGRSNNTWFFMQSFAVDGVAMLNCVFYFRKHKNFPQDTFQITDDLVSLFVTGGEPSESYDFGKFSDNEIRLREILFRDEEMYHYYFLGEMVAGRYTEIEKWLPSTGKSISDLVQGFYEDIFVKKIGV